MPKTENLIISLFALGILSAVLTALDTTPLQNVHATTCPGENGGCASECASDEIFREGDCVKIVDAFRNQGQCIQASRGEGGEGGDEDVPVSKELCQDVFVDEEEEEEPPEEDE
jgi:hypothetical protein